VVVCTYGAKQIMLQWKKHIVLVVFMLCIDRRNYRGLVLYLFTISI